MLSNLQIRLQNFKSYLDSGWVSLDGKNVLVGIDSRGYSNGSGKSSILDALSLFLDNSWEEYNKSEVQNLTNTNSPKKQYIIISVKCVIDGEPFEAQITGADAFIFVGDRYKLNKFQQELSGSIMNQGLINNLADFEKRSQLDAYIDQFYNVKEIITKLKDFQGETVSKLTGSLTKLEKDINSLELKTQELNQKNYSLKGQLELYKQYSDEDLNTLETKEASLREVLNNSYMDFAEQKLKLQNEKQSITQKLNSLKETESLAEIIERYKSDKQTFISNEKSKYLNSCTKDIDSIVFSYVNGIQGVYRIKYLKDIEDRRSQRLNKLKELQDKINLLSNKAPGYKLNEFEINELNIAVREWCPEEYKLGTTYQEVLDDLSLFYSKVKSVIEQESKEVKELRKAYDSVPPLNMEKSKIQKEAEELSIVTMNKKLVSSKPKGYYLIWDYNFETNSFEFEQNLPIEYFGLKLDINEMLSKISKFNCNTSYYDHQIELLNSKAKESSIEEVKKLNLRINEIDKKLSELMEKETSYIKTYTEWNDINTRLKGYQTYLYLCESLTNIQNSINTSNEKLESLNSEREIYTKRKEDLVKIIDSVSKYSGEELRNEFGFKLAKLSSMILNDIFNLDGEISLESNGSRTMFKYNDGNGFLSFKVLSGGQLQKIKLAINLSLLLFFYKDRQYIFLDEVFQHLDNPSKNLLINYIVKELGIKNILLIQHDSLKFEGFKEIRIFRDEHKNTTIVK